MKQPIPYPVLIGLLALLAAALAFASMLVGPAAAGTFDLLKMMSGGDSDTAWMIMREVRLPRTLLALMEGVTLGLGGAVLQGGAAQVDVVVGFPARGQGDASVHDGQPADQLGQLRAVGGVDLGCGHCRPVRDPRRTRTPCGASVRSPANVPKLPGTTFTAKNGPCSIGATQGLGLLAGSPL